MDTMNTSAIILAGGYSSRMGKNKAELTLTGKRLIDIQIDKMKQLGIEDIMLSGYSSELTGTRLIPDIIPHCGPVSGLHACLREAKNPACLVLSVDAPLIPIDTLESLISAHQEGVTMLIHSGKFEPLMAVYDCGLYRAAEDLLQEEKPSVMKLARRAGLHTIEYTGAPEFLLNCNYPEDYERLQLLVQKQ